MQNWVANPHLSAETPFERHERESLPTTWARLWREDPGRPLAIEGDRTLTRGELDIRSARVAASLLALGLRPGDRVLMSASASIALIVAYCAILRAGIVVVPMNTAYREREVEHVLKDADPGFAIVDSAEMAGWLRQLRPGMMVAAPHELASADPAGAALDEAGPRDLALICYTSGTTGAPKGAMLSHGNLAASAEGLCLAWRWTRDDRLVLCLPLFHLHGLGVGLNGTLTAGASMILLSKFNADEVVAASRGATLFFGVPTMYARLVQHPEIAAMSRLRLCVSGSAPLPPDLHDSFARLTGMRILERYGMTETLMNVSHLHDGERRAGTVGYPLPGVEMRLRKGTSGEILLRGPNVFAGYWRNARASAEAFEDGWFVTGDVGEIDADGQLRLVARSKELIISGGFNVYPREVEDVLRGVSGVVDAAVVGTPSGEWGEVVTAFIEGTFDEQAVLDHASRQLASYKRPRRLYRIDALPRNAMGKVTKAVLVRRASELEQKGAS